MSVDARIARGGVLGLWAVFFLVLWASGTSGRYLGPRTQWIVQESADERSSALPKLCVRASSTSMSARGRNSRRSARWCSKERAFVTATSIYGEHRPQYVFL